MFSENGATSANGVLSDVCGVAAWVEVMERGRYDGPSGPKRIPITRGESRRTRVSCVARGSRLDLGRFPAFPQSNQSRGGPYRQFLRYLGAVFEGISPVFC